MVSSTPLKRGSESSAVWFDAARIEQTVTRAFVCSHLLPEEIERLDLPLSFGGGLTDGTYWEWIEERAKKIFLILVDLGVPDQIFGVIDDSWDDDDLPIALDHVERLALTAARDERVEKKFYHRQFYYLLKPLEKGEHTVYQDMEVVPLDVVDKRPGLAQNHLHHTHQYSADRVSLPNHPGKVFSRRRIPLGSSAAGSLSHEDLQYQIENIRGVQNDHLVSYWGSYAHQGHAYLLFTPASDLSLKSLLTTMPASVKNLDKQARRHLVLNWIHCLVDTLCYIHHRGLSHGNIRPSTILLNSDNHIFYTDFTQLSAEHFASSSGGGSGGGGGGDKTPFDKEAYDYAAPEQWFRPSSFYTAPSSPSGTTAATFTTTTTTTTTNTNNTATSSSTYSSSSAATPASSSFSYQTGGTTSTASSRRPTLTALSTSPENTTFNISRGGGTAGDHTSPLAMLHAPNPQLNPQAADVFSLGCIILELAGLLLKRQTRAFAAHRSARHKTPGRGGAVLDSSFHKNLGQVESWMAGLAREAGKKVRSDGGSNSSSPLRGIAPILRVAERMLAFHPADRPSAHEVQARMYQVLTDECGIGEPHCVHRYGGSDYYPLAGLKLPLSPTATSQYGGGGGGDLDDDEVFTTGPSRRNSGRLHYHQHHQYHHHARSDSGGSSGGGGGGGARARESYARDLTGGFVVRGGPRSGAGRRSPTWSGATPTAAAAPPPPPSSLYSLAGRFLLPSTSSEGSVRSSVSVGGR